MAGFSEEEIKQLLTEYLRESRENIDGLDSLFVELENDPGDQEIIKQIFRRMHTIKGGAGFVGMSTLERVAHVAEDILTKALEQGLEVGTELTTALLAAADLIGEVLQNVEDTGEEGDLDDEVVAITKQLRDAEEGNGGSAPPATEPSSVGSGPEPEPEPAPATATDPAGKGTTWDLFGEDDAASAAAPAEKPVEKPAVKAAKKEEPTGTKTKEGVTIESSIRIDVTLLDKLMNLVGELVLARNQIVQFTQLSEDNGIVGSGHRLSLVTTELQENIMKTRMQPIGTVFSKFPRIIRDLAVATGKKLNLEIEGQDTELDRTIVESIRDPLTHIIRNSCDHGIEDPDVRTAAGKSPVGRVHIHAYHEGGQVNIAISDDGAGINIERVKAKAVERGVITRDQSAVMPDSAARMLIFNAGLSTAAAVTNISGRGVGMDVVRTNVEKIGGTIELDSELGKGTTIRIKIPLTLAIIPALVVGSGGEMFAIPQVNLHELVRLDGEADKAAIEQVHGADVYRLRGKLLPLVRLNEVLGMPKSDSSETCNILVLTVGSMQFGLVCDQVFDTEEIVVKPLSRHLKKIGCYAGATIMGDGRVALILDAEGLVKRSKMTPRSEKEAAEDARNALDGRVDSISLLVFSLGEDDRFAVPLTLVNRLEEFKVSDVEKVGRQDVIQYRDDILPLIDISMGLDTEAPVPDDSGMWSIVVVTFEGKSVGIKVRRIIDVAENSGSFSGNAGSKAGVMGAGVLQGRTTVFLDIFRIVQDTIPDMFDKNAA
ncbi:MAG: chemotaxis protein CheA, partial [Planctomycetota bacterium]